MSHHHEHSTGLRLVLSILLNLIITIAQIVGGIFSNSLSLISDALHNLTDTFSMGLSLFAQKVAHKKSDKERTFGYKRAEIIAALINTSALIAVSVFLFKEAFYRLFNPEEINGGIMFWVAVVGLIGNSLSAVLLFKGSKESLNIKSTFLHILSDALSSIAVIIGGILILYKGWLIIDPVLTFGISIYVLIISYGVLKETVHILMQGAPKNVSIDNVKESIETVDGVNNVHHIHIWSLNEDYIYFEAHICIGQVDMNELEKIKSEIKLMLKERFGIEHSTLEFEFKTCGNEEE